MGYEESLMEGAGRQQGLPRQVLNRGICDGTSCSEDCVARELLRPMSGSLQREYCNYEKGHSLKVENASKSKSL